MNQSHQLLNIMYSLLQPNAVDSTFLLEVQCWLHITCSSNIDPDFESQLKFKGLGSCIYTHAGIWLHHNLHLHCSGHVDGVLYCLQVEQVQHLHRQQQSSCNPCLITWTYISSFIWTLLYSNYSFQRLRQMVLLVFRGL